MHNAQPIFPLRLSFSFRTIDDKTALLAKRKTS